MVYLFYILTFGSFFLIKYLRSEREIKSKKELIFLVLFPMAGYGNWLYNKEIRAFGRRSFPRSWYICRKMVFQNFLLVFLSSVGMGFLLLYSLFMNVSDSLQISPGTITLLGDNIDPTFGMGLFLTIVISGLLVFTLLFFLVVLPAVIAKIVRYRYEKKN